MSRINEKLRVLLKNQGWTQAKLARRVHFTPDAVSSWVRGINSPSIDTLKELCTIFCITIQELIDDDIDIPEYYELYRYLPHPKDTEHILFDADLAYEGYLHRFKNAEGEECSAIYKEDTEIWWHYREFEAAMIRDWNEVHKNDR